MKVWPTKIFVTKVLLHENFLIYGVDMYIYMYMQSCFKYAVSHSEFQDFEPLEMNVTFEIDVTEIDVQIVITNDEILEADEDFFVMMLPVEGIYPLDVRDGLASIQLSDNDGKQCTHRHGLMLCRCSHIGSPPLLPLRASNHCETFDPLQLEAVHQLRLRGRTWGRGWSLFLHDALSFLFFTFLSLFWVAFLC